MPKKYHQNYQDKVESHFDVSILSVPILIIGLIMAFQLYFTDIFNERYILFFSISVLLLFISLILNDRGSLKFRSRKKFLLIMAHVFAGLGLLFFTNPTVPYSYAWIILSVVTFEEFKFKGLALSLASYALVLILYPVIDKTMPVNSTTITLLTAQFAIVAMVSYILAQARHLSIAELQELVKTSKSEEFERKRLQTLINSMQDAVMIVNEQGYINQYNAALLAILDTNSEIANSNLDKLFKLKDEKGKTVRFRNILSEARGDLNLELINNFGKDDNMVLEFEISPVRVSYQNAMQEGFIVFAKDITKQKSLDEERDEFISVVSHELRTPVATAEASISNLKFFLNQDSKFNQKDLKNSAEQAHKQILSIAEMLGDLSNLNRSAKVITDDDCSLIKPTDIRNLIFDNFKNKAKEKNLSLKVIVKRGAPSINTSKVYLVESINNLISNAIKYTNEGSVEVVIGPDQADKAKLKVEVEYTGIGLSKSDQQHIFDKFWRSEDYQTRKNGGMGLGLYVTKKLITKIGGTIFVKSRKGEGSKFTIIVGNID